MLDILAGQLDHRPCLLLDPYETYIHISNYVKLEIVMNKLVITAAHHCIISWPLILPAYDQYIYIYILLYTRQ